VQAATCPGGEASPTPSKGGSVGVTSADAGRLDEHPLGLWGAAGVHRRAFGRRSRGRIVSAILLLTPSWRVEHSHGVATLVARDPVSLMTWCLFAVLTNGALSSALASAVLGSFAALLLTPVLLVVAIAVTSGVGQRISAWRTVERRRGALAVSNVAADPKGRGHGTALMAAIVGFADGVGRDLSLIVDPTNDAAVHLYRGCGFVAVEEVNSRRTRMVRPATVGATPAAPPSWLAPIHVGRRTTALAAVLGVALIVLYWGSPVAWLMAPFVGVAGLAADSDVGTLRIPNRLVAAGASLLAVTIAVTAVAFSVPIVWPAIGGAVIFASPLFVCHALAPGRSGLGDVKLAAVLGLVAGAVHPTASLAALFVSMLLGSAFGVFWRRRRRGGFPLAPALAAGTTLVLALWAVLEGTTTW
jgi:leader peptidase (prepilin peptidase) / N-methyltransferase